MSYFQRSLLSIPQAFSSRVSFSSIRSRKPLLRPNIKAKITEPEKLLPIPEIDNVLTVSLVGRPNTGKSTLFNRFTHAKMAIVSNVPGTTRDRKVGRGVISGLPLKIIDTGGLDDRGIVSIDIQKQVESALATSDVVLFMLDSKTGVTALDEHFAKWLRQKLQKKTKEGKISERIILVANKAEGGPQSERVVNIVSEAYRLGFGEPILISATQGDGVPDLANVLIQEAQKRGYQDDIKVIEQKKKELRSKNIHSRSYNNDVINLAIMGRPNVGKSTLVNALLGEERVITGPTPGLTRDSIQVEWVAQHRQFKLVDTAGLTRLYTNKEYLTGIKEQKNQEIIETLSKHIEKTSILPGIRDVNPEEDPSQFSTQISEYALISALNTLRFADVIMLVVESHQGRFSKIDLQLAQRCLSEGRAVFIAANKFDLLSDELSTREYEIQVKKHTEEFFRDFGDIPIVACSGAKGTGITKIIQTAISVHDAWDRRINTWILNKWLKELMVSAPSARAGTKAIHIKYITQVKGRPPTFALFTNVSELPPFFERFLRSKLQDEFSLSGIPIRFIIKKSEGKAVKKHLLKQGKHTSRGRGMGENKGKVGPHRKEIRARQRAQGMSATEQRRRRDTRLRRARNSQKQSKF